jgi:PhzF family phenazine biosynthesis protein
VLQRAFAQVDVFTDEPFSGNPVAVVLDGEGLTTEEMQRFARWTNLSETTFILPPTDPARADYQVRIFTPATELPFAGHPTLGTCHAWLSSGGEPHRPKMAMQECGIGLVPVRLGHDGLAFAAPALVRSGPVEEPLLDRLVSGLGIEREGVQDAAWIDNGPGWVGLLLADAEAVLAVRPGQLGDVYVGVVGPYPPGSAEAFEVRAFFPGGGQTVEDPVTGSLNASIAQWLLGTGRARAPYVASQGRALARKGRVRISTDADGTVWVGGGAITCLTGHATI